jgi:hypothetical protein
MAADAVMLFSSALNCHFAVSALQLYALLFSCQGSGGGFAAQFFKVPPAAAAAAAACPK